MTNTSPQRRGRGASGLRANALAGLVMLLIEYSLGISVNLYSKLPTSDAGKPLFAGLGAAVGNGPFLLAFHAVLGTLLLLTGVAAVVRASRLGARHLIALSAGALVATLVAWLSGSEFVGHMKNSASLTMALAAAVAILCYALVIFVIGIGGVPHAAGREA
ncbi:MAG TPA: hypothetical protein VG293_06725 [Solirubrobacteraceae bacterium]|jgi:hypothetical protein|nr:hypothetical protein [Solirubrobacteraceae bacterium]